MQGPQPFLYAKMMAWRRFAGAIPRRSNSTARAHVGGQFDAFDCADLSKPLAAEGQDALGGPATAGGRDAFLHIVYYIRRLPENPKNPLAKRRDPDSTEWMIRPGFLDRESRQDLIELARNGSAAHRLARRANALVLLDDGMSCEAIAKVLLLDDDTIRTWYRLYEEDGIEGLTNFGYWAKKAAGQKVTENTYATMTTF